MGRPKGSKNKKKLAGDHIEDVLNSKVVKPVTEAVKKVMFKDVEDCGCEERKEIANNWHQSVLNCFDEATLKLYRMFRKTRKNNLDKHQIEVLNKVSNHVFGLDAVDKNCASCNGTTTRDLMNKLDKLDDSYDN